MWNAAEELAAALERALAALANTVTGASPGWLVLGVLLHLANQVLRGVGWHAVVRAATGGAEGVRRRDSIAAWVAGAGASGLASARGGDAVRVLLLRRRLSRDGCPLLAGTLVAEGAGELAVGALLLAVALIVGVGPALGGAPAAAPWVLVAGLAAVGALAIAVRRMPTLRRICARASKGCAVLRQPRAYGRDVLPWQLGSRACRFVALLCFLAAFGLPATPEAVLLVMAAQGGGRLLPFAPASVTAGAAMLAAAFQPVTGETVAASQVAAFFVGTSTVLTVVGIGCFALVCSRTVPWAQLTDTLRAARRPATATQAPVRADA